MFTLPNLCVEEGKTDAFPIVLSDTVEQFRDLLWILYAPYVDTEYLRVAMSEMLMCSFL